MNLETRIILVWIFSSLSFCSVLPGRLRENRTLGLFDEKSFLPHTPNLYWNALTKMAPKHGFPFYLHFVTQNRVLSWTSGGRMSTVPSKVGLYFAIKPSQTQMSWALSSEPPRWILTEQTCPRSLGTRQPCLSLLRLKEDASAELG